MLQFVSSPTDGRVGLFDLLALVNSAAVNVCVHVFVLVPVFDCFEYVLRRRVTRLFGNPIFNFLRNCQTLYYNAEPFYIPISNV